MECLVGICRLLLATCQGASSGNSLSLFDHRTAWYRLIPVRIGYEAKKIHHDGRYIPNPQPANRLSLLPRPLGGGPRSAKRWLYAGHLTRGGLGKPLGWLVRGPSAEIG